MDARAIHRSDPAYPSRLTAVADAPDTLWMRGRWIPAARSVAVVGARAARKGAIELAYAVGAALGQRDVDVISGGALGIDAAAHRGALSVDGVTVAVLGSGVDIVYPRQHEGLFTDIAARGALLTQFPPGQQPHKGSFPTRNKVIAGLAEVTLVVEAAIDSGSLHTARAARAFGRRVAAVPGSPGTDALLVGGALPVLGPDDVLAVLEGRPLAQPPLPDDPEVRRLYQALDATPRDVGDLAFRAGLGIGTCAAAVIDLELGGLAARAGGGRYVRLR